MSKPMPRYHTIYTKREYIDLYQDIHKTDNVSFLCILGSFLEVQVLNGWYFWGLVKFQIFFGVLEIPDFFGVNDRCWAQAYI